MLFCSRIYCPLALRDERLLHAIGGFLYRLACLSFVEDRFRRRFWMLLGALRPMNIRCTVGAFSPMFSTIHVHFFTVADGLVAAAIAPVYEIAILVRKILVLRLVALPYFDDSIDDRFIVPIITGRIAGDGLLPRIFARVLGVRLYSVYRSSDAVEVNSVVTVSEGRVIVEGCALWPLFSLISSHFIHVIARVTLDAGRTRPAAGVRAERSDVELPLLEIPLERRQGSRASAAVARVADQSKFEDVPLGFERTSGAQELHPRMHESEEIPEALKRQQCVHEQMNRQGEVQAEFLCEIHEYDQSVRHQKCPDVQECLNGHGVGLDLMCISWPPHPNAPSCPSKQSP
mmetsp:Transcript_13075/g.38443  ORF Transcript_13075/g.38443 Transcript_13075/m.38443 type:complete len:345 (-) Transcript_13075:976-2010(-)